MKIFDFDMDSPMMTSFTWLRDTIVLNMLTFVCCLPVVTIGASLTAMHSVCLKIERDECGYVSKQFFEAFKENFKQATIIWLLMIAATAFIAADYYAASQFEGSYMQGVQVVLFVLALIVLVVGIWIFKLLARFEGSIKQHIVGAFKMALANFPRTLLMTVVVAIPYALVYIFNPLGPIFAFVGLAWPGAINARVYDKLFEKMEENISPKDAVNDEVE